MPMIIDPYKYNSTFMSIITDLGLTSNLKLVLDAGDAASYTSGQPWLDRSGNGYDFNRGTTSGAEGSDPTFNGTAGKVSSSEYFSFDGGDVFTYDSANETWMNNLHKNNAKWGFTGWFYLPSGSATGSAFFGTNGGPTTGIGVHIVTNGQSTSPSSHIFRCTNSGTVLQTGSTSLLTLDAWIMLSCLVDEAGNTMSFGFNDTFESFGCTYSGPSVSNATNPLQIGARGNSSAPQLNGNRCAAVAMWEGGTLPTTTQLADLFSVTRRRFGV